MGFYQQNVEQIKRSIEDNRTGLISDSQLRDIAIKFSVKAQTNKNLVDRGQKPIFDLELPDFAKPYFYI